MAFELAASSAVNDLPDLQACLSSSLPEASPQVLKLSPYPRESHPSVTFFLTALMSFSECSGVPDTLLLC